MASVEFDSVTIAVHGAIVLRDVSLDIADGEFVGVIGPSGSGKTSLIRTIAGFTDVVRGRVLLDGIDVTRTKTADRGVGMVFQEPVMFRRRNVRRNVSFPLEIRRREAEEIRDRVDAEARAMHLEHLLARRPSRRHSPPTGGAVRPSGCGLPIAGNHRCCRRNRGLLAPPGDGQC